MRRDAARKTARVEQVEEPVGDQGARIGFLIHDVSRMRRTLYDLKVKPLGLTRSQWWVLAQISREGRQGALQTELAKVLEVGKVTVGGLVDRLEANGFVERRPDAEDRRAKRVVITPSGRAVLKSMVALSRRLNLDSFGDMTEAEIAMLESLLDRMKQRLREQLEQAA